MRRSLPALTAALAAALLAGALAFAGCGDSAGPQATSAAAAPTGDRQDRVVHSILPMSMAGDDSNDMVAAMKLALEERGANHGAVHVTLAVESDSGTDGNSDPARAEQIARKVVADPASIGIIGTLTSSGSKAIQPITNRASLPILGISATAVGLTRRTDGRPGMPPDVAPTGKPNLVRLVPNDARQSLALAAYMKEESVGDLVIINDGKTYGVGLTASVVHDARRAGIRVHQVMVMKGDADAARVGREAAMALADSRGTPAVLIAGNTAAASVAAAKAAALANDQLLIFGPDSMALRGVYANLGSAVERRVYITSYLLPVEYYGPLGVEVFDRLAAKLGRKPTPTALYAYEAMDLLLASIGEALPDDTAIKHTTVKAQRAAVTAALLHTFDRGSVVGTYSIDVHGDTTNTLYGAYRVENKELVRGQAIDTGANG
jgi:ABC-type branched-subunit amino acid transport system substrate-binding protein